MYYYSKNKKTDTSCETKVVLFSRLECIYLFICFLGLLQVLFPLPTMVGLLV